MVSVNDDPENGGEPDPGGFFIASGSESRGPYSVEDIRAMADQGSLAAYSHVWIPARQEWLPLQEWLISPSAAAMLPVEPERTNTFPSETRFSCRARDCRNQNEPAVTTCGRCGTLLCADCVRFGDGDFLCARCAPSGTAEEPEDAGDKVRGWFGPMQEHPERGVAGVLIGALVLFLFFGRSSEATVEGISSADITRSWQQSTRALRRAHFLVDHKRDPEARKWLALADEAAARVVADESVMPGIWEQSFTYRMRVALDLEDYAKLHELVSEFERNAKRVTRDRDLKFFRACDLYLSQDKHAEAIEILDSLAWGGDPWDNIGEVIDFASQRSPAAQEKAKEFMVDGYTRDEVLYRIGQCHALGGRREEAIVSWKQASEARTSEEGFLAVRDRLIWRQRAQEALNEEKPGP